MIDQRLRSLRFRTEREETWTRLEALVKRLEGGGAGGMSDDDMIAIPALYRATLSSLSVARETSLDAALIEYLEALSARAYFCVYGARTTLVQRVGKFFMEDWPAAVRSIWRETLISALFMALGVAVAWVLVAREPSWFYGFVPEGLSAGREPGATAQQLRETLYGKQSISDGLSFLATFLFTHNAQIAMFAFALGIAFCVPSAFLMAYNGCMLGAMFAIFSAQGLGENFGGWVFVHGVTELFAITLAGAAGFHVGWSMAFPGAQTRLAAAESAGRRGGVVMIGVVIMLFIAGLLEGFVRQLVTVDATRWGIAGVSLLLWLGYFYAGPRKRAP